MQPPKREVRYVVVGIWNTAFGFVLFTVLQQSVGHRIGYVSSLVVAQAVAVVQAHVTQRRLVWHSQNPYFAELIRFAALYGVVLMINVVGLALLVERLKLPVLPSQYGLGGVLIVATYFAQRRWAFAAVTDPTRPDPDRGPAAQQLES